MPTLAEAKTAIAKLKAGDPITLHGESFEVCSQSCGVLEYVRPEHREITGSYQRVNVTPLAEAVVRGEITLGVAP